VERGETEPGGHKSVLCCLLHWPLRQQCVGLIVSLYVISHLIPLGYVSIKNEEEKIKKIR
jgi:hypothetical protein